MAEMTLSDRIIRFITQGPRQMIQVESRSKKYTCYAGTSAIGNPYYLYIGNGDAIWYNRHHKLTGSVDIAGPVQIAMKRWEDIQATILYRGI